MLSAFIARDQGFNAALRGKPARSVENDKIGLND